MVAPLIGRAIMSAGARVAGQAATRSAGGQALATGSIGGSAISTEMLSEAKAMNKKLKSLKDAIVKSSPALMQQMVIMRKSFSLFLRPIGDIMAKYVRPMASWMIRMAMRWYQLWGTGGADPKSKAYLDERRNELLTELSSYTEGTDEYNEVLKQLASLEHKFATGLEGGVGVGENEIQTFNDALIAGALLLEENMGNFADDIASWGADLYDNSILPWIEEIKTWPGLLLNAINAVIAEISTWPGELAAAIGAVFAEIVSWPSRLAKKIYDFGFAIGEWAAQMWKDYIVPAWTNVKDWGTKIYDNYIKAPFKYLGEKITEFADSLKKLFFGNDDGGDSGGGGYTGGWSANIALEIKKMTDTFNQSIINSKTQDDMILSYLRKLMKEETEKGDTNKFFAGFEKSWAAMVDVGTYIAKAFDIFNQLDDNAIGGPITETGLHKLHAGEYVVNAGATRNMQSSKKEINITNHFTITGQLNNKSNLRNLARQLAALQEVEIRRRASYI